MQTIANLVSDLIDQIETIKPKHPSHYELYLACGRVARLKTHQSQVHLSINDFLYHSADFITDEDRETAERIFSTLNDLHNQQQQRAEEHAFAIFKKDAQSA